jgi:hypothetical protein
VTQDPGSTTDVPSRRAVRAAWVAWLLVTVGCVALAVVVATSIREALRTDASVVGIFADTDGGCPDRVEYVVDGVTHDLDVGRGWCGRTDLGSTAPQRVYYDSDDPEVAVFADPVGTTPTIILDGVVIALLAVLVGWLQWMWWCRQRAWWSRVPSVRTRPRA